MMRRLLATTLALAALLLAASAWVAPAGAAGEKVLMVVADQNFQDKEYNDCRSVFDDAGLAVTVASPGGSSASGMNGGSLSVDLPLSQVSVADYDAVVFIGGQGSKTMVNVPDAQRIAREMFDAGKVVSAICHAPVALALAGVLDGKEGTVYDGWGGPRILKEHGCHYKKSKVVVDGRIVTADGPKSAKKFAKAVVEVLQIK